MMHGWDEWIEAEISRDESERTRAADDPDSCCLFLFSLSQSRIFKHLQTINGSISGETMEQWHLKALGPHVCFGQRPWVF